MSSLKVDRQIFYLSSCESICQSEEKDSNICSRRSSESCFSFRSEKCSNSLSTIFQRFNDLTTRRRVKSHSSRNFVRRSKTFCSKRKSSSVKENSVGFRFDLNAANSVETVSEGNNTNTLSSFDSAGCFRTLKSSSRKEKFVSKTKGNRWPNDRHFVSFFPLNEQISFFRWKKQRKKTCFLLRQGKKTSISFYWQVVLLFFLSKIVRWRTTR